ncbi:MAG TPA: peptidoglycan-binding domain-containing protein, partial [Mariprofundaceae bacterium]|nr:peptidoglycan-binding domain-containing protein [Mariprofundaceae bacterium]
MELKQGAKGDRVIALQKRLTELGFSPGKLDGVFGKKTSEAVLEFQRQAKLAEDGIIGPAASAALGFDHIFHVPEDERWNYKNILLANPNYFGNVQDSAFKPVKVISSNTSYEELSCIGLNPAGNWLQATIQIKRPYGFGGYLCG